jgi:hypothetical protein
MSSRSLKLLGIVAAILVALLIAIEVADAGTAPDGSEILFADFRDHASRIESISVVNAGYDTAVTINKSGDQWQIQERDNYPADTAKIREIVQALADARIVEIKTANPELHHRLGLRDPDVNDSKATRVTVSGSDFSYGVLFGNVAQGNFRYLRKDGEDQSWLVDQNPAIPATAGGWLLADVVDVENADVAVVTIRHPEGDVIRISKDDDTATNYVVDDIPEGRELSYPTVANGIVGALNDLTMEDVRVGQERGNAVETVFESTDGVQITAWSETDGDEKWVSFAADAGDAADDNAKNEAEEINSRLAGWQFKISDYTYNLLTRQWNDLLKNLPDAE